MNAADVAEAMAEVGCSAEQVAATLRFLKNKPSSAAARQKRYRERKALRNEASRDVTLRSVTSHSLPSSPKKERVPPTPPLLEKTPLFPTLISEAEASLVPEVSGTCDIKDLRKDKVTLFQTVVGMWNELAAAYRLVSVRDITAPRQAAIIARSEDFVKTYDFPDALAGWRKLIGVVRGSPFLRGELNGFRCDFDFVTKPKSFTKIMEGKYEARVAQKR